jgi:hypothetical protein
MRYTEHDREQESLRGENRDLQRQLDELKSTASSKQPKDLWHPSAITIWAIFLGAAAVIVVARRRLHAPAETPGRGRRRRA